MSDFWPATIGTAVGGFVSIATTYVTDIIRERRTGRLDQVRTATLRRFLSDEKFEWRTIQTLSDAIGAEKETTVRLLLLMGARKSLTNDRELWSMAPWPENTQ